MTFSWLYRHVQAATAAKTRVMGVQGLDNCLDLCQTGRAAITVANACPAANTGRSIAANTGRSIEHQCASETMCAV